MAGVISVQKVTGSVSTVVPGRAPAGGEDETSQDRQAVVTPLGRQLSLHLPAPCFSVQTGNASAKLLPTLGNLKKQEKSSCEASRFHFSDSNGDTSLKIKILTLKSYHSKCQV